MMPQIIPFDNTGSKTIEIALGENYYKLHTYYLPYIHRWILDIFDSAENPIILGICLNVGVDNLVKGKSSLFEGQTIRCVSVDGKENDTTDSLGTSCLVYYYQKGEEVPSLYKDKMLG